MGYITDKFVERTENAFKGSEWSNDYHIKIIDGYSIRMHTAYSGNGEDIRIVFKVEGQDYLTSCAYRNLSEETVKKVKEVLDNQIGYNKICIMVGDIYGANSFIEIICQVEKVIKNQDD